MIVFVVEGEVREPNYLESLIGLYFKGEDCVLYPYGTGFGTLHRQLSDNSDWDLQGHLIDKARCDLKKGGVKETTKDYYKKFCDIKRSDIGDIYLFFDYDAHHHVLEDWNAKLDNMLGFFSDEGDHGKLYMNYPMVESLQHIKSLPDSNYKDCLVAVSDGEKYKKAVSKIWNSNFSDVKGKPVDYRVFLKDKLNWELLKQQNVSKANYVVNDRYEVPSDKKAVSQQKIFDAQKSKFVANGNVSVLNSIPIFLWEYFK